MGQFAAKMVGQLQRIIHLMEYFAFLLLPGYALAQSSWEILDREGQSWSL
jgi:hypothetical protein